MLSCAPALIHGVVFRGAGLACTFAPPRKLTARRAIRPWWSPLFPTLEWSSSACSRKTRRTVWRPVFLSCTVRARTLLPRARRDVAANDLIFDWSNPDATATLSVTTDTSALPFDFENYREWDLVTMTANYFRLILSYVADASAGSGVLVHCISGERSPARQPAGFSSLATDAL